MSPNQDNCCTHPKLRGVPSIASQAASASASAAADLHSWMKKLTSGQKDSYAYWLRVVNAVATAKDNARTQFKTEDLYELMECESKEDKAHLRTVLCYASGSARKKLVEIVASVPAPKGRNVFIYALTEDGIVHAKRWATYCGELCLAE